MFDKHIKEWRFTPGTNSKEFIVLHSVETWDTGHKPTNRQNSTHILIKKNGEAIKYGEFDQILWHCAESFRGEKKLMNRFSIWITLEGTEHFTDEQYRKLQEVTKEVQKEYNIPEDNILTHQSITWKFARNRSIRDEQSPTRKNNPDPSLWRDKWMDFTNFRKKLLNEPF